MMTMPSSVTSRNRQDLLASMMHSQSAGRIIEHHRFGQDGDAVNREWMAAVWGGMDESSALFAAAEVLAEQGYDVDSIGSALDCGAITAEELGEVIDSQSVSYVNNHVLTELLRHHDGCELDLGTLRMAGYDYETMASALYVGAVSKPQLLLLVQNHTRDDVDWVVSCLLERTSRSSLN